MGTFSLIVIGNASKLTGGSWNSISDKRIKENIVNADYQLCYNDVKNIPLRRFTYTSSFIETYGITDRRVLGFLAQELSSIQPKSISINPVLDIEDGMWINTEQINYSLFGSVKKVIYDKEALESTSISLVTLNTNLTQRVSTLEGLISTRLGGNV
jgi:hypothetical protein